MLLGYLIGLAIISAISAGLILLVVRLLYKQKVAFTNAFVISFISALGALFGQMLFDNVSSKSSFIEALPGFVFFLLCWLLNAQFIKYGEAEGSKSYGKAFLVTTVQCVLLFIFILVFSLGLMAALSSGQR
jgi:hypothetical protein